MNAVLILRRRRGVVGKLMEGRMLFACCLLLLMTKMQTLIRRGGVTGPRWIWEGLYDTEWHCSKPTKMRILQCNSFSCTI